MRESEEGREEERGEGEIERMREKEGKRETERVVFILPPVCIMFSLLQLTILNDG